MSDPLSIAIGKITITLREQPALSSIACGAFACDVGRSFAQRLYDELVQIRETLRAAHAVIVDRERLDLAASAAEIHLAHLLVKLDVTP